MQGTDDRGAFGGRANQKTHLVTIGGIGGGATIDYQIESGGALNTTSTITIPTTVLNAAADLLTGKVTYSDGGGGAECLVHMRVSKDFTVVVTEPMFSLWSTKLTAANGTYNIDITNIRQDPANVHSVGGAVFNSFDTAFSYLSSNADSKIYLQAECDDQNTGATTQTTLDAGYTGSGYNNFDAQVAEPLNVSIANVAVDEDAGNAILTLTLNQATSSPVTVQADTANATAIAGSDYTAVVAGPVTIPANETTTTTTVPIINDALDEGDETFTVTLSNPSSGLEVNASNDTATVTIQDDGDDPPTVSMDAGTQSVTEATTTINVVVNLSGQGSGLPITVTYSVTDGTATGAGDDYTGTSPIIIDAGDTSGNITIDIHGDLDYEGNETFTVGITGATTTDQTVTTTAATTTVVTINNDDALTATDDPTTQPGASYTVDEDGPINVTTSEGVLVNDSVPTTTLTAVLVTPPSYAASFTLNPDGSFDYQHDGSENATDTFTYNARFAGAGAIGDLDSATPATVTITVTPVNDAPVANNDFFAVLPATELTVPAPGVLGAAGNGLDTDAENDNLTAVNLSFTPAGTVTSSSLTLNPNGSFTYNPGDFVGTQTFTYQAQDDSAVAPTNALSNVATVTLSQGPTLIITVTTTTVDEDQSQFVVDITLVNPSSTPSTADVKTVDGTANSGSDFGAPSAPSISLSTANTTTAVTINVVNDTATPVREGDEWFYVTLSNPGGGAVIAGGPGTIVTSTLTIVDPADAPTLSIDDIAVTEPSSAGTADIVVRLTGRTLLGAEVDFDTADGTSGTVDNATAPDDYTTKSTTVIFLRPMRRLPR